MGEASWQPPSGPLHTADWEEAGVGKGGVLHVASKRGNPEGFQVPRDNEASS